MGAMGSAEGIAAGAAERRFLVGQDRQGRWVAVETRDRAGGLFRSRHDALRLADEATGHRPGGVGLASQPLHQRFRGAVMIDLDLFRHDLAGLMRAAAQDRRRASAGAALSGEDLKIIALFERLAGEAQACGAEVHAAARARLSGEPPGRCLRRHRDMLAMVGSVVWPAAIEELVRWMTDQIAAESGEPHPFETARPSFPMRWWAAAGFGPFGSRRPSARPVIGA